MKAEKLEYTVMGDDGKEYGPVTVEQIRQWIAEGRLEKKTPVKPANANDWMFLGDLEEFASIFAVPPLRSAPLSARKGLMIFLAFLILTGAALGLYYYFQHLNPH